MEWPQLIIDRFDFAIQFVPQRVDRKNILVQHILDKTACWAMWRAEHKKMPLTEAFTKAKSPLGCAIGTVMQNYECVVDDGKLASAIKGYCSFVRANIDLISHEFWDKGETFPLEAGVEL